MPEKDLNVLLEKAVNSLTKIDVIYSKSGIEEKRKIISSMYPQKFSFENLKFRTINTSNFFNLIYLINSKLKDKKSETTGSKLPLSRWVFPTRFELISAEPESAILSIELRELFAQR